MRIDPPYLGTVERRREALFDPAMEEMQLHRLFGIVMPDDPKGNGGIDTNVQFFEQFPLQTFFQCLSRFPLPSRKLPKPAQMHARFSFGDQITAFVADQSC